MEKLNIPVGISDFREIRENGYYYIDKTFLIYELLKTPATKVTLITRPRRFGKTLGMSMLADFFDIRKESSSLFEGLDISEKTNICNEWLNQYPVIFLSLKDIDGLTFKDAYGQLVAQIADLSKEGQCELILPGGRGGKGNSHFATSTRQAPRFAQDGEKGIEKEVILELKLLADVGLIGFPSVGKSTILSRVTSARPKIADYHFTTLEPNLGVVKTEFGDSFVLADIPGIIEGASEGTGLGLRFLRHIERTRLLLHVIDVSGSEGRNPVDDFNTINKELKKYSEKLSTRKQIIVANKIDAMQDETLYEQLEKLAKEKNIEIFKISAATGEGLKELFTHVSKVLKDLPKEDVEEVEEKKVYTLKKEEEGFNVRIENGVYIVDGPAIEKILRRANLEDNESLYYFQKSIRFLGVEDRLKQMGIKEGDTVKFMDWEMEWFD